ncbi:hypothetical protein LOS1_00136 [Campylobacter phage vB_CjeM_Los1]|uniref:Chitin-binding type-3 domain-containing protein n=1 Tax=Campylobacter phage vB_CjeM_Los1 TaxID=1904491 RepID=A0A1D8EXJ4_9CAUD|nr:hypothetical protein FDH13_gp136 [Campylobacter phage vB_CjeM_Los1]AOT25957.1 hypothetical protein LOS1_00136 [Campylobacter phage vB_CjeM_Los1]
MAITNYTEFEKLCPKNGEIADQDVLGKPSLQLKRELDTVISQVNSIIGIADPLNWDAGTTYTQNQIVKYNNSIYVSLSDGNRGNQPDTSASKWKKISGGSISSSVNITVSSSDYNTPVTEVSDNSLSLKPSKVYVNGNLIPTTNYTHDGTLTKITFINGMSVYKNDVVTVEY